jgi:hypothetical protein
VGKPPVIDGQLDDWERKCPIPLIGRNQLQVLDPKYQWQPANLNGVAYLGWDAQNLYVAVEVIDDLHQAAGEGETVTQGDSVALAIDPSAGGADAARQAFVLYVSSQRPTGGSGTVTLWRSRPHSGGRPAGHLARDSSVCEVVVKPGDGRCVYELRLPWSELGGIAPVFAGQVGLSLQLNDNDGSGPAAWMNWGGGLSPAWSPSAFGRVTLVE